jgi:NAD(P)-dependent dehydrogenase (short-subunit alcohol dehydrogenase family)
MSSIQRTALVTGASRGIGRGIALELARRGYRVAVNYARNVSAAEDVAMAIEDLGSVALPVQGDIAVASDREKLVDAVLAEWGKIDLLVNNAGIAPRVRNDILEASEESFDEVLGTNLKGPYFLTQRVAREMIKAKELGISETPRIVFVTSVSAYAPSRNRGEYCISKAGLSMAVQIYAARLAEAGIPVFEVRPGIIETDMVEKVKDKYTTLIAEGLIPFRRWGQPLDVALPIAAIAQGELDFCSGQVIEPSGGFHLREL